MLHRDWVVRVAVALAVAAVIACAGEGRHNAGAGKGLNWSSDLKAALTTARSNGKLVMVDFYTDWCGWCRKLDETTFADAKVVEALDGLVAVKLDAERGGREAARRYGVDGYPTVLFLDAAGTEVGRIPGYLPPGPFLEELGDVLEKAGGS